MVLSFDVDAFHIFHVKKEKKRTMHKKVYSRPKTASSRCLKLFRKREPHEDKKKRYCRSRLLGEPFITGFAKIAKSKISLRKAIKLFVFFICSAGFIYHTWTFLEIYLVYPTMLDVSEEYPVSFSAPAITICHRNRLFRQRFCEIYPDACTFHNATWEEFCATYKRLCPNWIPDYPDQFTFGIPKKSGYYNLLNNRSSTFLDKIGPNDQWDVLKACRLFTKSSLNGYCKNFMLTEVTKDGLPYKCFSQYSLLGNQNDESTKLTFDNEYSIILNMHPEEYMSIHESVQVSVFIHDPRKLVNPMAEGLILAAGKCYNLYVTMEKKESLPPPYASKCTDYLKAWKKNGGHGPLSKKDCSELCKIKAMADEYGCVGWTATYPNNYTICERARIVVSPEMNRKCSSSCQDACEENIYRFTTEVVSEIECTDPTDEHCKNEMLYILVRFSRMTFQKSRQIPRFESIELFSYIGGYLGMWLGISLTTLFDFVEMIYGVIAYLFFRRKRKQKSTMPVKQFRHVTL